MQRLIIMDAGTVAPEKPEVNQNETGTRIKTWIERHAKEWGAISINVRLEIASEPLGGRLGPNSVQTQRLEISLGTIF